MYCGRLQKNANCGVCVGSCVTYFILMCLPLVLGGGVRWMMGSSTSLSFEVGMRSLRCLKTSTAVSRVFWMRCFVFTLVKMMGTSLKGVIFWRMVSVNFFAESWSFSIRSHLFTMMTTPLRFFSMR